MRALFHGFGGEGIPRDGTTALGTAAKKRLGKRKNALSELNNRRLLVLESGRETRKGLTR